MTQKGLAPLLIVFLMAVLGLCGFFIYSRINLTGSTSPIPNQIACTQEAKLCPDGSSVGRSGPKCEFAACPASFSDKEYLKQNPLFGYSSYEFGEAKTIIATVKKATYGPPFDPNLFELDTGKPGYSLFAKSRLVDLNNYIDKKVVLNYREVKGVLMAETQLVLIDSVTP